SSNPVGWCLLACVYPLIPLIFPIKWMLEGIHSITSARRRKRLIRIAQAAREQRAIGPLLALFNRDSSFVKSELKSTLVELLPLLTSTDQLDLKEHEYLTQLVRYCHDRPLALAALTAIGRIEECSQRNLFAVRALCNRASPEDAEIRALALETLPRLERRQAELQQSAFLLRASQNAVPQNELLRATRCGPASAANLLIPGGRPKETTGSDAANKDKPAPAQNDTEPQQPLTNGG
ncbi:MAG TPA: hypothetical protein VGS41_09235, partial [Chthonomonadales bacterium]|nr:hypothetical protein [Chthonomonadales bacterium]